MEYCKKCGAPLVPGNKFCTKCGAPVIAQPPQRNPQNRQMKPASAPYMKAPGTAVQKKSNAGLIAVIVAAVCAVALIAGLLLAGREKAKATDPFESVSISYSGAFPYLKPEVVVKGDDFSKDDFTVTDTSRNDDFVLTQKGDEFIVQLDASNEDGKYTRTEKKYSVGDASTYITDPGELEDSDRSQLVGFSEKVFKDHGYEDSFIDPEFEGCYTAIAKSAGNGTEQKTYAVFIYDDEYGDTCYCAAEVPSLVRQSDGTLAFDTDTDDAKVYYNYDSLKSLYSDIIESGYDVRYDSEVQP